MDSNIRRLPIGVQDFEKLRRENCIYVDKTAYIYELLKSPAPYFLSRPSRFGKSLFFILISTMANILSSRLFSRVRGII